MAEKLLALVAEIAAEMDRQGMTRNALAVKAGVPAATVTRILAGDRPDPQLSTVVRMAWALGKHVALTDNGRKDFSVPPQPKPRRPRKAGGK